MTNAIVTIKGQQYQLPPLTTGQIRRSAGPLLTSIRALSAQAQGGDRLAAVAAVPELIGQHADLLHLALSNRYPDITLEDVETLHFGELQQAVADVIRVSGLRGNAGGDDEQGEATAPAAKG